MSENFKRNGEIKKLSDLIFPDTYGKVCGPNFQNIRWSSIFHKYSWNHTLESRRNIINFLSSSLISSDESKFYLFYEPNFLARRNFKTGKQGSNGNATSKKPRSSKRFKSALKMKVEGWNAIQQKFQRAAMTE